LRRKVAPRHKERDDTLALEAALHGDHAGGEDDAPLSFLERWPDHQVGDAGLVFDAQLT
jgi:hypothetical protein